MVLTITPEYFEITGGISRWLYRLCRKHCGKQAQWIISVRGLHQRSGSTGTYREFKRKLKKAVEDGIPQYDLVLAEIDGTEKLHVSRDPLHPLYDLEKVLAYSKPKKTVSNSATAIE